MIVRMDLLVSPITVTLADGKEYPLQATVGTLAWFRQEGVDLSRVDSSNIAPALIACAFPPKYSMGKFILPEEADLNLVHSLKASVFPSLIKAFEAVARRDMQNEAEQQDPQKAAAKN